MDSLACPPSRKLRRGKRKIFLDRIYRIARIDTKRMNDRSETPRAFMGGEALMIHIKGLEKLPGSGTG
jgi:hypothetical protein